MITERARTVMGAFCPECGSRVGVACYELGEIVSPHARRSAVARDGGFIRQPDGTLYPCSHAATPVNGRCSSCGKQACPSAEQERLSALPKEER